MQLKGLVRVDHREAAHVTNADIRKHLSIELSKLLTDVLKVDSERYVDLDEDAAGTEYRTGVYIFSAETVERIIYLIQQGRAPAAFDLLTANEL